ncbi:MAG: desulfoferrodoxin [Lachnospiraceae bacterium]|nr:desulfoferrodoxin [Lachnospiraceae bacterium]
MRFFKCEVCGKIIAAVNTKPCPTMCCGKEMVEMVPNTVDAAKEKHVPVCKVNGNIVEVVVGEVAHPMTEEHQIDWIAIETETGNQRKVLKAGAEPKATFALVDGDKLKAAYAYCNLHGLWKA